MAEIDLRPLQKDRYNSVETNDKSVLESLLDSDENACVSKQNKPYFSLTGDSNATSIDPTANLYVMGETDELLINGDTDKLIPDVSENERIIPAKKRVDFVDSISVSTENIDDSEGKHDNQIHTDNSNDSVSKQQNKREWYQNLPRRDSVKLHGAHRIFDIIPVDSTSLTDGPTTPVTLQSPTSQGTVPPPQQYIALANNAVSVSSVGCSSCSHILPSQVVSSPHIYVTSANLSTMTSPLGTLLHPTTTSVIQTSSGTEAKMVLSPSPSSMVLHPIPTSVIQTSSGTVVTSPPGPVLYTTSASATPAGAVMYNPMPYMTLPAGGNPTSVIQTSSGTVVSSPPGPVLYTTSAAATPAGAVMYNPMPYMTLPTGGNIALLASPHPYAPIPYSHPPTIGIPNSSQNVPHTGVAGPHQGTTFIRHPQPTVYHTLTAFPNTYHTVSGLVASPHPHIALGKTNTGIASSIPASLIPLVLPLQGQGSAVGIGRGLPRNVTYPSLSLANVPEGHTISGLSALPSHYFTMSGDQDSMRSFTQMTVRSAGGLSIDVGSTDGRNINVRGTVSSPEQLPYLPNIFRYTGDEGEKGDGERATWANKAQFVLACVGYAVGLGNIWRFPYLCYKSGGGAFLIPYLIMLFLCGIPLLLMELAVGQYTRKGPIGAMAKICPFFKGAGVGTVMISFLLGTYYNVIIAWTIFYLFQSFNKEGLPWSDCNKTWAANSSCYDGDWSNGTAPNDTTSPTQLFFDKVLLQKTSGIEEAGEIRLELVLALFFAWILVYFSLWKSIKSSGKVVYVTATVPYLLIGIFLWRALTLPGAYLGLQYFFKPKWHLLLEAEVWVNAASQNFNSIGIAFGSLIAFSSYNKRSNNIILDTWAISLTNSFTSLLAGLIVFATMGNIALEQGKSIDEVVDEGPGLVFVVYPQALAKFPYANVWAALFFFMLLILGLDSQFATVEVIVTSLKDGFPDWIKKYLKRHEILVLIVCLLSFLMGLPHVTQGGIYMFQLIDYYAAAVSLMYLAFFEVIAVVWLYGANRLARNVKEMTGRYPSAYFRYCWYFAAPVLILSIWLFSMVQYKPPTYNKGEYHYPPWAIGMGWCVAMLSIGPIPIFAVIAVVQAKGNTVMEKFLNSLKSTIDGCPCCGRPENCHNASVDKYNEDESFPVKLTTYNTSPMNGVGVKSQVQDSDAITNGTVTSQLSSDASPTDAQHTNTDDVQLNNTDAAAA